MTSSNQPARPIFSRPVSSVSLPRTCSHGPSHARSGPVWFCRYCAVPSATVLFSVSPWVRNSGTFEPAAPGIRSRAFQ